VISRLLGLVRLMVLCMCGLIALVFLPFPDLEDE